jgi:small subunit ribosomal protein S1
MSWTRHVRHPSKIVNIGDAVECMVLKVDKENEKISLSLKQTESDPWDSLDFKYPVRSRFRGKVRNLTNFGAFVELEEGIDGLVHISDMSWTRRINHPSEVLKKGDEIEVEVLNIDKDGRRISLGLKQTQENPWPKLQEAYAVGTMVTGKVVRIIERGAVVDLGNDVEGFVPLSQLGLEPGKPIEEGVHEGDELELRVTKADAGNQRIVLAVKGVAEEMEEDFEEPAESYQDKYAGSGTAAIGDHIGDNLRSQTAPAEETMPETEEEGEG